MVLMVALWCLWCVVVMVMVVVMVLMVRYGYKKGGNCTATRRYDLGYGVTLAAGEATLARRARSLWLWLWWRCESTLRGT